MRMLQTIGCFGLLICTAAAADSPRAPLDLEDMRRVGSLQADVDGEVRSATLYALEGFLASVLGGYPLGEHLFALSISDADGQELASWRLPESGLAELDAIFTGASEGRWTESPQPIRSWHDWPLSAYAGQEMACVGQTPKQPSPRFCVAAGVQLEEWRKLIHRATDVVVGCAPPEGETLGAGLMFECAQSRYQNGAYAEAIDLAGQARDASDDPEMLESIQLLTGRAQIGQGNYQAAIDTLSARLKEDPENLFALVFRARAYLLLGGLDGVDSSFADLEKAREFASADAIRVIEQQLPPMPERH